jgi:hypothetical protein
MGRLRRAEAAAYERIRVPQRKRLRTDLLLQRLMEIAASEIDAPSAGALIAVVPVRLQYPIHGAAPASLSLHCAARITTQAAAMNRLDDA